MSETHDAAQRIEMQYDQEALITVELIRCAASAINWHLSHPDIVPATDETVALSRRFLHAWMQRKMPTLPDELKWPK